MRRLLLCLTAVLVLSGCGGATAPQGPASTTTPTAAPTATPTSASVPASPSASATRAPTVPTRLRLGDIDAAVVPIELDGTSLTPPADPSVVGWWGRRAGAAHGTTLLTGHTVHDGGGTFDDLEDTPLGTRARVDGHVYRVRSVEVIPKEELARRAEVLFDQGGPPRLVLVTCEDYDPDTGHYASNVVVVATPVG